MLNISESESHVFRGFNSMLRTREICKAEEKGNCLYTSVATTKPLKCFFAQSSPSISSVSTEQSRTCATSWPAESLVAQNEQENLLLRTIQKRRLFLQN